MAADALLPQQSSHENREDPCKKGPPSPLSLSFSLHQKALFFVFHCGDPSPNLCLPLSFNT